MTVKVQGLAVKTKGLVHVYVGEGRDIAALAGVDLTIREGEMVGLLGPSGAGKSTLLSLLAGLFRPTAGVITVGDVDLVGATRRELDQLRAGGLSLMLQGSRRNLLPYLSARENIEFARVAARRSTTVPFLLNADELIDLVGLPEVSDQKLALLAPGQLQLVALAVALSTQPGLLLIDEPTSQLDHEARDNVLAALSRINRGFGTTVVVVTHDPVVAGWMRRTVTIRDGRVGGEGRSGEEYSVVTADGFLPLSTNVLDGLPPGTLVRFEMVDGEFRVKVEADPR